MSDVTYDFTDRTVIVTGAGRGIGRAIGARFAGAGADVWMVDVDEDVVRAAAEEVGANWGGRRRRRHRRRRSRRRRRRAGEWPHRCRRQQRRHPARCGALESSDDADWDAVLRVHLGGTFRFTRACVPHFRERWFGSCHQRDLLHRIARQYRTGGLRSREGGNHRLHEDRRQGARAVRRTVNAISPNAETRMVASIPPDKLAAITAMIPLGRSREARGDQRHRRLPRLGGGELHHRGSRARRRRSLDVTRVMFELSSSSAKG